MLCLLGRRVSACCWLGEAHSFVPSTCPCWEFLQKEATPRHLTTQSPSSRCSSLPLGFAVQGVPLMQGEAFVFLDMSAVNCTQTPSASQAAPWAFYDRAPQQSSPPRNSSKHEIWLGQKPSHLLLFGPGRKPHEVYGPKMFNSETCRKGAWAL